MSRSNALLVTVPLHVPLSRSSTRCALSLPLSLVMATSKSRDSPTNLVLMTDAFLHIFGEFSAQENIISFSNYPPGTGGFDPIDSGGDPAFDSAQVDIEVPSTVFKQSKCASSGDGKGKGGKGGGGRALKKNRKRRDEQQRNERAIPRRVDAEAKTESTGTAPPRRRLNPVYCSSSPLVTKFHQSDVDSDGRLTCTEAGDAFAAQLNGLTIDCPSFFAQMDGNPCFVLDGADLILAPTVV